MTAVTKTWRHWWPFSWLTSVALPSAALSSVALVSVLCRSVFSLPRLLAAALSSVLCRSLSSVLSRPVPSTLHSPTLHRVFASAVLLPLTWSVTSTLAVFPHELSYFNEIVGGSGNGHEHLLDANIDWGQDLLFLKRWYEAHLEARPFHVVWFGFDDPNLAGIDSGPVTRAPVTQTNALGKQLSIRDALTPGWYAISTNELYGYKHFGNNPDQYACLREYSPAAYAGYSVRLIHIGAGGGSFGPRLTPTIRNPR